MECEGFSQDQIGSGPSINQSGMSLVELLVVIGLMSILAFVMMAMQNNQMKSNNFLQFQVKRTQLQNTLIGQFLNDPKNCSCLFEGANAFPINPPGSGQTLTGVNPRQIGRYNFTPSGTCATATVPQPFITRDGVDGLKLKSVQLTSIKNISGSYSGKFVVGLESVADVLGADQLNLSIPVSIETSPPASGQVRFLSCSTQGGGPGSLTWLTSTPMVLCSSDGDPSAVCGATTGTRSDSWTDLDLKPLGVSANAKTVILRVFAHEASVFVKKANRAAPPNYTNQVMIAWNDYSGFAEVRVDLTGSNSVLSYAVRLSDPPSYTAMIQIVGYED